MTNRTQSHGKRIAIAFLLILWCFNIIAQVTIPADSLKKHVYFLASDSLEGRGLSTPSGVIAANYIANYFEQVGIEPVGENYLHPFYTRYGVTMLIGNNVVGIIEGADPELKDEYIVLGAHFDHIAYKFVEGEKVVYNGADDNATGTSSLIEIGRELVKHKSKLKRSIIIVAFDGEESGLIGSGKFIEQEVVPIENVKVMMSIDMIGRYKETGSLTMGAMSTLNDGTDILKDIADKFDLKTKKTGADVSNRTDSKPFGDAGIPAFHVTSGITGPYHKPEDDRETIDYDGMEKISSMLYELTIVLANKDSLNASKAFVTQAEKEGIPFFRYGVKFNFGVSSHLYPNEFYNGKRKVAGELGLITQFKITKNISLQPEVLYSTKASGFQTGEYRTHSVTTPVSIVYGIPFNESGRQRFYVNAGMFYSYHFYGSTNGKELDFKNTFEQEEFGLAYGLGFDVDNIFISLNFSRGLSNLAKDESLSEFKNRATYFSVAYMY